MARRPGELSVRPRLRSPRQPSVPGRQAARERAGRAEPTLEPEGPEIVAEQEEAFLNRYNSWNAQWNGSLQEFIVWEFLVIEKKQIPQLDFVFQYPIFGGRTRFGGFILDYYLPMRAEGWRVMGERWHLEKPESRARDAIAKVQLTARGLRIIDLWESDLLERKDFVLNLAWEQSTSVIRPDSSGDL